MKNKKKEVPDMRKTALIIAIGILALTFSSTAYASLKHFSGKWESTDPHSRGIKTLHIDAAGPHVTVQVWGKCGRHRDCDWGKVTAHAYSSRVSSDPRESVQVISAIFQTDFGEKIVLIRPEDRRHLSVEVLTHYRGRSRRSDYQLIQKLSRKRHRPRPFPVKEDCVSFNPLTTEATIIDGRWKIVDGGHWLFDFGEKRREAYHALKIVKYYRIDQSCFIGRPHPSFQYLLSSGKAPKGPVRKEDCLAFDPDRARVKFVSGSWKIIDGRHWLYDFGNKENEARHALTIIKKYRFTHSCFVGRPQPSFKYLRR
jgi:hypothetical protein